MPQDESTSIIGKGIFAKGDLVIIGSIRIEGTLQGNLTSTGEAAIAAGGTVNGDVITKDAVLMGTVNGNLTATNNTSLETGAVLNGNLYTAKVTLAEGSKFNGKCTMIKRRDLVVDKDTKDVKLVELSPEEILTRS